MQVQARPEGARDRSFAELLGELTRDISTLVRQEVDLAKAEIAVKSRQVGAGGKSFGIAAALGLGALGAGTAFAILVLATFLPGWAAALIVAVAMGGGAVLLSKSGKEAFDRAGALVPEQTVETIKEDVEWAKTQTRSVAR